MPLTKADKSMLDNVTSPSEVDTIVDSILAEGVEIADGSVTSDKIVTGAITADKIKVTGDGAVSLSTIDATASNNLANALTNITALQNTVTGTDEGLLNTFYQSTQPSSTNEGDLWFNTTNNQLKRYNGTAWQLIRDPDIQQAIDDAADAANLADSRITTYYSNTAPTNLDENNVGDLWFDIDNNNKLHRLVETSDDVYEWVSVQDTTNFVAGTTLIDGGNISTGTITTTSIASNSITTDKINANAVTADKINANAITTDKINTNAITADKIASNAITSDKIAADSITADRIKVGGNDGLNLEFIDDTAANNLANALTNITALQNQVTGTDDGLLNTFYQSTQPSSTNVGDLWFNTTNNQLKRYNGTEWQLIRDPDIQEAIDNAADAANVADKRISTYYSNTEPTIDLIDGEAFDENDVGDLWFDTDNNNKLYRLVETSDDVFEWVSVQDTTNFVAGTTLIDGGRISTGTITADQIQGNSITADKIVVGGSDGISLSAIDATAANDLAGALTNITALQNTVSGTEDGLLNTFYQNTEPSSASEGDLWFNDSAGELRRYNGTVWELITDSRIQQAVDDAANAANVADSRITTYYSDTAPTVDSVDGEPLGEEDVGDLWFDTDDGNKLYRFSEISPDSYAWVSVQDKTNFVAGTTLIDGGRIFTNTITTTSIVDGAITSTKIDGGAITTDKIDANAITSDKISAGAIASGSMFAAGVIQGEAISSDTTISSTFQSTNFDGQYDAATGNFNIGNEGFYLHGDTGTAVFNTMVCRENIISGNFIKFNDEGGFAVDDNGNFKVAVDDETLTVNNGRLAIGTVPSTAIVNATADLNFAGGYNTFSLGDLDIRKSVPLEKVVFVMDTHDYVESVQNLKNMILNNFSFNIDYSGLNNITDVSSLQVSTIIYFSDSPNELLNTPVPNIKRINFIQNPVLPLTPVTYNGNIPKVRISNIVTPPNPTNRYLIFSIRVTMSQNALPNNMGSISLSVNGNTETSLVFEATGEIDSANNNITELDGFANTNLIGRDFLNV